MFFYPKKMRETTLCMSERYFGMDNIYFNEIEDTWVELYNDDGEREWYYLNRFVTTDKFRDMKLIDIGI